MTDKSARGEVRSNRKASELRLFKAQFEVRAAKPDGSVPLEGYACVTETPYEMWDMFGPYEEAMAKTCFAKTLSENPDVALLLNHGGMTMARTKPGTLQLAEDDHGLHWSATVNPARGDVRDMLAAIEDEAVDECSFAFRIIRQEWSPDWMYCRITEVDIDRGDVSVVNYGANPATSIGAARSADVLAGLEHLDPERLIVAQRALSAGFARAGLALPEAPAEPVLPAQRAGMRLHEALLHLDA